MSDQQGPETSPKASDEKRTSSPEIVRLILSLSDPAQRRLRIRQAVQVLLVGAAFPIVLGLPGAIGKMFAVGIPATIEQDAPTWVRALYVGPAFIACLLAGLYAVDLLGWCIKAGLGLLLRHVPDKIRKLINRATGFLVFVSIVGGIVYSCGQEGYEKALKQRPSPVREADQKTIAETQEAAAKQQQAIKKFSSTADALLKDLDKTALKVTDTKREIAQTMELFDRQMEATQAAQANLSKLAEKQREIQSRTEELDRILKGEKLLTTADMDRRGREGQWQGFWQGVVSSLIATFIFIGLDRLRTVFTRRKRPEGDDTAPRSMIT